MKIFITALIACFLLSCAEHHETKAVQVANQDSAGNSSTQPENGFNLTTLSPSFFPEPESCDLFHSKFYYCDGYSQRTVPISPITPNPTVETASSNVPPPSQTYLQVIGEFQASRPSIVFVHGWNPIDPKDVFPFPDQWAQQSNAAGYNVLAFQWVSLSYDSTVGCPGVGSIISGVGVPCNAAYDLYRQGRASDLFLAAYKERFTGYQQPVRLAAHSLGAQLSILSSYRMYKRNDFANVQKPSRIDLIDPFMTPSLGPNRDKPLDGQLPSDAKLPPDVLNNIVTSFKPGSKCQSSSRGPFVLIAQFTSSLSQYCQNEGMAYSLVKDFNVGMINFGSLVATVTAPAFKSVMITQAFLIKAFKGKPLALHNTPIPAYFYSLSPGVPINGYDASSTDQKILTDARNQAVNNIDVSRMQTSGLDTVTFRDDGFR